MDRNETIKRIRTALRKRSGKPWSVTGGRGTAWGWLTIDTVPKRRRFDHEGNENGEYCAYAGTEDRAELAKLLGLDSVSLQGESIPASSDHYREFIDRAEGRVPSVIGTPYWD